MNTDFRPVYEAPGVFPVALEVAEVNGAGGSPYLHHRLVVGSGRPGVVIVAESTRGYVFVRSWRAAVGEDLWELPRGAGEPEDLVEGLEYGDETLVQSGLRELLEETGFVGTDARVLGRYFTDSTVYPQRVGVVRCTVDVDGPRAEVDGEIDEVTYFTAGEVRARLAAGEIRDAHSLAALAFTGAVLTQS